MYVCLFCFARKVRMAIKDYEMSGNEVEKPHFRKHNLLGKEDNGVGIIRNRRATVGNANRYELKATNQH